MRGAFVTLCSIALALGLVLSGGSGTVHASDLFITGDQASPEPGLGGSLPSCVHATGGDGADGTFGGGDPNTIRTALTSGAAAGQTTLAVASAFGFSAGTELLIWQVTGGGHGTYELACVASQSGGSITLTAPLDHAYAQDPVAHTQVMRVPHFATVTGFVTGAEWNGSVGGLVVFRALNVSGATIDATAKGFKGGYGNDSAVHAGYGNEPAPVCTWTSGQGQAQQGHSYSGPGGCTKSPNAGGGGGGGQPSFVESCEFGSGGGGGFGTAGASGGGCAAGQGGTAYGQADLGLLDDGSGGAGATWGTNPYGGGRRSGNDRSNDKAGQGSGSVLIFAGSVSGASVIANGANGGPSSSGFAGGGGSGGAIRIVVGSISGSSLQALGGSGGVGGIANGGAGGAGRIQLEFCDSASAVTATPLASTAQVTCVVPSTTTTLATTPNPSRFGQPVTLTASVTASSGTPTGSVTFFDGALSLGAAPLDASGNAVLQTNDLSVGTHSISAAYGGDGGFPASTSPIVSQVVSQADTATTLSSDHPAGSAFGVVVTFKAKVTSTTGTPTGSVTFLDGTTVVTAVALDATATAALTTSALSVGTHTISASYSGDDTHNTSNSAALLLTVSDTTTPVVQAPANMQTQATSPQGAAVSYQVSATDPDDAPASLSVMCAPASGSTFPIGTNTVSCTATDPAGNVSAPVSFTVSVKPPPAPTIAAAPQATVRTSELPGNVATASVAVTATAVDGFGNAILATCSPNPIVLTAPGTASSTCSATDAFGRTAIASTSATLIDDTPPSITVPADIATEATSAAGASVTFSATAIDNVDGPIAPSCTPASGSTFALGTTSVTCSARDAAGNTASATFAVTVTDTTPPVVTVPANITAEATGPVGAVVTFTAIALDRVDGTVATTCTPAPGSTFAIGTRSVTCTATDAHGNTGTASFTITVRDTTPPVVTVPANIIAEATGASGAPVTFTASALDTVDGSVPLTCTPASGSTFAIGTRTVTCTATDVHGNSGTASFAVTVRDTTAPALTLPANITTDATSPSGAIVVYVAIATDIVDGTDVVTCRPRSGATFALGTTAVACSATDAHGNIATGSFTVTVRGASQQLSDLSAVIKGLGFPQGTTTSLLNKVQGAIANLASAPNASCNQLSALLNEIKAQTGRTLTTAQAAQLTDATTQIRSVLGCK